MAPKVKAELERSLFHITTECSLFIQITVYITDLD